MARNKGGFVFASNFEVKLQGALDPRVAVDTKSDLINKETWPYDGDTIYLYKGLIVAVADTGTLFMLVDPDNATAADYSGWKQLDAAAATSVDIINNLTSDRTDAALSAAQGKALMTQINTVAGKLTAIYTYKGSVATYDALPTDATVGDVYNVEAAYNNYPAGTNYAYTAEGWDALGGSVDLSAYYTGEQVDATIKVETDRAVAEEARLEGLISTNTTNIATNKSDISKNTENINAMSVQIGEINDELANKVDVVEGKSLVDDAKITLIDTNAADIATLKDTDTSLDARLKAVEGMIGDGGEVDLSSLTELVTQQGNRITTLETDNTTNKGDISTLKTQVAEIVTTNTEQSTQLSNLSSELTTVKSSVSANTSAITNLTTTVNGHTQDIADIKDSINGLAVKSVKEGDTVLAADASGVLSTTISLDYDTEADADGKKYIRLKGIDGADLGKVDVAEFVKDGMIDSVVYNPDSKKMTITWNTDAGKEATEIDMTGLVDTYTAGSGLKVESNTFSVVLDSSANNKLSVSENGLLVDISADITALEGTMDSKIEDALAWEDVES